MRPPQPYSPHDGVKLLDPSRVRDLSGEAIDGGRVKIMPAGFYRAASVEERALLGARHALYSLPTQELVEWLRAQIGARSAIEIGAGNGVLAEALGIRATDNWMQDDPLIAQMYAASGQKTIVYDKAVLKLDAEAAVAQFKPQVVVACWVTHRWREDRPEAGGNMFGPDEGAIVDACESYIFIGNEQVHRNKAIWNRPHRIIYPEWLYSRAHNGSRNFIAVWGK